MRGFRRLGVWGLQGYRFEGVRLASFFCVGVFNSPPPPSRPFLVGLFINLPVIPFDLGSVAWGAWVGFGLDGID